MSIFEKMPTSSKKEGLALGYEVDFLQKKKEHLEKLKKGFEAKKEKLTEEERKKEEEEIAEEEEVLQRRTKMIREQYGGKEFLKDLPEVKEIKSEEELEALKIQRRRERTIEWQKKEEERKKAESKEIEEIKKGLGL